MSLILVTPAGRLPSVSRIFAGLRVRPGFGYHPRRDSESSPIPPGPSWVNSTRPAGGGPAFKFKTTVTLKSTRD
jgi:hypothetical protein